MYRASRSSKDHDFATVARQTVEKFIGEKLTGEPLDDPNAGKNPAAARVALFMMYYNFARVHKTLRCSPAMAAGVDIRLWEIKDIVAMIESYENSN